MTRGRRSTRGPRKAVCWRGRGAELRRKTSHVAAGVFGPATAPTDVDVRIAPRSSHPAGPRRRAGRARARGRHRQADRDRVAGRVRVHQPRRLDQSCGRLLTGRGAHPRRRAPAPQVAAGAVGAAHRAGHQRDGPVHVAVPVRADRGAVRRAAGAAGHGLRPVHRARPRRAHPRPVHRLALHPRRDALGGDVGARGWRAPVERDPVAGYRAARAPQLGARIRPGGGMVPAGGDPGCPGARAAGLQYVPAPDDACPRPVARRRRPGAPG